MPIICSRCNSEYSLIDYEENRFCRKCGTILKMSRYQPETINDTIGNLVQYTWEYYQNYKEEKWKDSRKKGKITDPSIPVLFFGNLNQYRKSKHRIITVGLNPSEQEFPQGFSRFKGGEELYKKVTLNEGDTQKYLAILSNYFSATNFTYEWFDSYEVLLNSIGASYYARKTKNIALHTDICTPLATSPTWRDCPPQMRKELSNKGAIIWDRLIKLLEPHLVLISVKQEHLNKIKFGKEWTKFHTIKNKKDGTERKTPYVLEYRKAKINNTTTTFIHDKPGNVKPFLISGNEKRKIGKIIQDKFLK